MTSLLPDRRVRPDQQVRDDLRHRRPLVAVAFLGGVGAAAATLTVCLAIGVLGWFLSDAGVHGTPRGGLRVGALGWLLGHGSGVFVSGVAISVVPLGVTLSCAWVIWRVGQRVGDSISAHGPDADRIADGERDWTVPLATVLFTTGYLVVAVLTLTLASGPDTRPDGARVAVWVVGLCLLLGASSIAVGAGRAAVWTALLPGTVRAAASTCRRILVGWLVVGAVALVVSFALDLGTALNLLSELRLGPGETVLLSIVSLAVVPNGVGFAGSYLLGPGFTVGAGTLVTPTVVGLGPLPSFPLLAALPSSPAPSWTAWLVAVPFLVGAWGAARTQRRLATLRWDHAALHGIAGGVLAGLVFGVFVSVVGGAVGPGRLHQVGPEVVDTLLHAVTAFGVGGLVGALLANAWARRRS